LPNYPAIQFFSFISFTITLPFVSEFNRNVSFLSQQLKAAGQITEKQVLKSLSQENINKGKTRSRP